MEKNYKEYVAIISQSSTDAPTLVAELENDFGSGLAFSAVEDGVWAFGKADSSTKLFPPKRTICNFEPSINNSARAIYECGVEHDGSENLVVLKQFDLAGAALNGFVYGQISVKVYNKVRK